MGSAQKVNFMTEEDRYLPGTNLQRAAEVAADTNVEVTVQSKGGRGKSKLNVRIKSVKPTTQPKNEQVIVVDNSGKEQSMGGGTAVKPI